MQNFWRNILIFRNTDSSVPCFSTPDVSLNILLYLCSILERLILFLSLERRTQSHTTSYTNITPYRQSDLKGKCPFAHTSSYVTSFLNRFSSKEIQKFHSSVSAHTDMTFLLYRMASPSIWEINLAHHITFGSSLFEKIVGTKFKLHTGLQNL